MIFEAEKNCDDPDRIQGVPFSIKPPVVESKDRIPVEILKSQYSHLSFDYDGRLLKEGDERQVRLAMDTLEPVIDDKDRQVVDVRHNFARERYVREYLWQPSPEIEAPIWKEIFGRFETDKS